MLILTLLFPWKIIVFHPLRCVGAGCIVMLQGYVFDWPGIDPISAVVKTMHVRAHAQEERLPIM